MVPPLSIIHLDDVLVAIDKPAGMLVHPGRDEEGPEWIAMKRVRDELGRHVYPVHRLDRPTSGVLVFALDLATCAQVQQYFEHRRVEKTYLAWAEGSTPLSWTCDMPLRREADTEPQSAFTAFERVAELPAGTFSSLPDLAVSLLEIRPRTGRYHQIRRHLAAAGHPICGDFRYAGVERSVQIGEALGTGTRMLLQAKALCLPHPRTGEPFTIEAPVDPDFRAGPLAQVFDSAVTAPQTVQVL